MTVDTKMPFLVPVFYVCIQVSACTVQAVTKGLLFWPSMSVWLPGGGGGGLRTLQENFYWKSHRASEMQGLLCLCPDSGGSIEKKVNPNFDPK